MPAWRLDNQDRSIARYDVGASDGEQPNFIQHILLFNVDAATMNDRACTVDAVHMGPPLQESPARVDVIGVAELDGGRINRGERRQIKAFVDDRLLERRAQAERP